MALTLPINLSASPLSAVPPDLTVCQPWFMRPVALADCQTAFANLPVNQDPVQYRPKRRDRREPMGLLAVETHGSCSLKLHASGKWVEENDFAIGISPNKVRDMFSRVMENCVEGTGGFATQGLDNTISWITREDTEFPGEPPKVRGQPRNLYIPESATFLTAMIWSPPPNPHQFEPGANHVSIGLTMYSKIVAATEKVEAVDPHSPFAKDLRNRGWFLAQMMAVEQVDLSPPFWTWWGTERRLPTGPAPVSENGSLASLFNATGLQSENLTSLGLERFGDEDCTATTVNGPAAPCSVSRRLTKRRKERPVKSWA